MPSSINFSDSEISTLVEDGWAADDCAFTKIRLTPLSCGCCSAADTLFLSKLDDSSYRVNYWPHDGADENHHTTSLSEAINWF